VAIIAWNIISSGLANRRASRRHREELEEKMRGG
jgi:hypothetical protein